MGSRSGAKSKTTRRATAANVSSTKLGTETTVPSYRSEGKATAVRKSTLLGVDALADLEAASSDRGRTQREAIELGLAMLVERDKRLDAMQEFINWSIAEFGEPSPEDHAWAQRVVANG